MSTRSEIIKIGDALIRNKGINAFSFYDIAKELNIKNASIHYHFPSKPDLVNAIIDCQTVRLHALIDASSEKKPLQKLQDFLSLYTNIKAEGYICLVGSLSSDMATVDKSVEINLRGLAERILEWVTSILAEGQETGIFKFSSTPRTKALMVITNMIASLQLTRLTADIDFETIKDTIIKELTA